ncbi:hypothetical protein BDR22DRAFT_922496 [Usnea florida]
MQSFLQAGKVLRCHSLPRVYRLSGCSSLSADLVLRFYHDDGRRRLSAFWVPTGGITPTKHTKEDSHSLLINAGFIRQAHSGLFHFLPLGLRVQEKAERLLDKHMLQLGASKLSLSTFSSEDLWEKTGRLQASSSEASANSSQLFKLQDRKGGKYLLSPTHEEEITSLIGMIVKSYKELPLRLYQISRKYRDEPRPRQGLLRTREFLMKDLYTFDATTEQALQTYQTVRQTYHAFFSELKLPFLTAEASSGEIGGSLSHEYHFPSKKGEDNLVICSHCNHVVNEELAESRVSRSYRTSKIRDEGFSGDVKFQNSDPNKPWVGISRDRNALVQVFLPREIEVPAASGKRFRVTEINPYAIKRMFTDIDLGVDSPYELFEASRATPKEARIIRFVDMRYVLQGSFTVAPNVSSVMSGDVSIPVEDRFFGADDMVDFVRIETGDSCPNCSEGTLKIESAVELGHTFHLGTRYSTPLELIIDADPSQKDSQQEIKSLSSQSVTRSDRMPVQMGCHGIGVSRLIAAVADSLADAKGLNWPRVMAPFEAIIVPTKGLESEAPNVYDLLTASKDCPPQPPIDAILDDRERNFGWKLKDADMIGYPVIVILGRDWRKERRCEVQCRRLTVKESVSADDLQSYVEQLLEQL